jgi:hypothetical protein
MFGYLDKSNWGPVKIMKKKDAKNVRAVEKDRDRKRP